MNSPLTATLIAISLGILAGCSSKTYIDDKQVNPELPQTWHTSAQSLQQNQPWVDAIATQQLLELASIALNRNQDLIQLALDVEVNKQQLVVSDANFWPELTGALNTGRNGNNDTQTNTNSLSLDVNYEIDIWGKLSDNARVTKLNLLTAEANYQQARDNLVAEVVSAYYQVVTSQQLVKLYKRRTDNAKVSFEIIESGYVQGLNTALDVYLTQNEFYNEQSNLYGQRTQLNSDIRQLERLLGGYPAAKLMVNAKLPLLPKGIEVGVPSELVKRKPALQSAWYQLLAQDASVAYTQKQRYPSLKLGGSVGTNSSEFGNLFDGDFSSWSVFAGLTSPIFNAGRLKAQTEQQKLQLKQQEQQYLSTLFTAFEQVENALDLDASLQLQYQATLKSQANALQAETLSFEQYQLGLQSYTTVLDAQTRSFVAQTSVINLKNQIIANRIQLHLALGGDLDAGVTQDE
ncbi:TolC family protein [Shewanella intestini]|uniref:TolC family protein n=1 Tax=Shewanella intestini TaxID=2017544 RepID=A0ABS5I468_9GAMM|nr:MULTISPECIES: TolC family protein [Shewanella]MBR9728817.1 TolC family protein [Shewanella intestini]MRG36893.1 efflux transporter outer membrane subunit [Shewanella sp. XMDDZSB0408]